jgi:capping protein alpha
MSEEVSAEQKLNISTYFLMSAPTGEADDVLTDVQKLVNDNRTLSDKAIEGILKDYNCEQLVWGPDPEDAKAANILVSSYGQVAADSYVDPNSGRVLRFDHRKRKFTEVTDKKQVLPDEIAKYRTAVQAAVDKYCAGQFKGGKYVAAVYGADNGTLTICISAKNVNLSNFWTGGWRSVYHVNVGKKGSAELKGSIKVQVHYFEDGNVQLHTNIDPKANVSVGDEESTGKEIAKALVKLESDFQSNLEEMYVNMHRTTFKAMRRFLPISRQPMNWSTAAHSLAAEVSKSS